MNKEIKSAVITMRVSSTTFSFIVVGKVFWEQNAEPLFKQVKKNKKKTSKRIKTQ